jgi:hypothetical protein
MTRWALLLFGVLFVGLSREIVVFISVVFCFSGSLGTCFQWRYREKGIWSCW